MADGTIILVFVLLLQIKHLIADFFLQTGRMLAGRDRFWHLGRAQHAGIHVAGSLLVLLVMGIPAGLLLALLAAEFVVHFLIDWGKARVSTARRLTPDQAPYWWATGTDQALHQVTYLAMVWACLGAL